MTHARFAQQIDAEAHAFVPERLQHGQCRGDVRAGDEIVGDRGDPPGNRLGQKAFGQPAGLHSEVHAGGSVTPGWLRYSHRYSWTCSGVRSIGKTSIKRSNCTLKAGSFIAQFMS